MMSLATYARTNAYGFIETPYRRVYNTLPADSPHLVNRKLRGNVASPDGTVVREKWSPRRPETGRQIAGCQGDQRPGASIRFH